MKLEIIYEDNNILAANKPSGLVVHADGKTKGETLVDFIVKRYPHAEKIGEPLTLSSGKIIHRAGIVHRLDKETSGVIVIAKNQETFLFLKKQFQERTVKKEYRAIVYGAILKKRGMIDAPIGRSAKNFKARSTHISARGLKREAQTEYITLARSPLHPPTFQKVTAIQRWMNDTETREAENGQNSTRKGGGVYSYLSVYPRTGRTHQVRVHLQSIGHPVLCDGLYASKRACPKEMGRLALHARTLTMRTLEGAILTFEAPLPEDFKNALTVLFTTIPEETVS
ncbi:MAG: RluA family pseudouridine synthase [Parcubacteria group bacterium]|nr:RluA family pseudouridine synthase [Parcubacteria group bacterium]